MDLLRRAVNLWRKNPNTNNWDELKQIQADLASFKPLLDRKDLNFQSLFANKGP